VIHTVSSSFWTSTFPQFFTHRVSRRKCRNIRQHIRQHIRSVRAFDWNYPGTPNTAAFSPLLRICGVATVAAVNSFRRGEQWERLAGSGREAGVIWILRAAHSMGGGLILEYPGPLHRLGDEPGTRPPSFLGHGTVLCLFVLHLCSDFVVSFLRFPFTSLCSARP